MTDSQGCYDEAALGAEPSPEKKARFEEIHKLIDEVPKYGNDIPDVDYFARDVAYTYTKPLQKYKNPRGGHYQAGLYPVSANVPLGGQTGATPDGRYAHTPVAGRRFSVSRQGCEGPDSSSNFRIPSGSLYRIQRNTVQSEIPSVCTCRKRGPGEICSTDPWIL